MAGRCAPHPLAELICELVAPPLAPSYLRVQASDEGSPTQVLLVHVCRRREAAGAEAAVYGGYAEDDNGRQLCLSPQGPLYALPDDAAGLAAFATDLVSLAATVFHARWGEFMQLQLPVRSDRPEYAPMAWESVTVGLLDPSVVQALPLAPALPNDPQGPRYRLRVPPCWDRSIFVATEIEDGAAAYAAQQAIVKHQLTKQRKEDEGG